MSAANKIQPPSIKEFSGQLCRIVCTADIQGMFGVKIVRALEELVDEEAFEFWQAAVIDFQSQYIVNEDYYENFVDIGKAIKNLGKRFFVKEAPADLVEYIKENGLTGLITPIQSEQELGAFSSKKVERAKRPSAQMDVNFVNPIIGAVIETLKTQCSIEVKPEKAFLKNKNTHLEFDVAAAINLKSTSFNGSICLCLTEKMFLKIMQGLLGEEFHEVSEDLMDGIAEVLNITFGVAKRDLNKKNYQLEQAIPQVVKGKAVQKLLNDTRVGIVLPF